MTNEADSRRDKRAIERGARDAVHEGHARRAALRLLRARAQILNATGADYSAMDILPDPRIREELSGLSGWPTIPQLFVGGELVGGCDIVTEMFESGELAETLGVEQPQRAVATGGAAARPRRRRCRSSRSVDGGARRERQATSATTRSSRRTPRCRGCRERLVRIRGRARRAAVDEPDAPRSSCSTRRRRRLPRPRRGRRDARAAGRRQRAAGPRHRAARPAPAG